MDKNSEDYYRGWRDGIKECLKLAEQIDDTYMVVCLKDWLGEY
jgi:hypothetical protein